MALLQYPRNPTDVRIYAREFEHIRGIVDHYQNKALRGFPLRDAFLELPNLRQCIEVQKGSLLFDRHPDGKAVSADELRTYTVNEEFSVSVCLDDRLYLESIFDGFESHMRGALIKYENHPFCEKGYITTFVPFDIAQKLSRWDIPHSDRYLRAILVRRA